jgi:hypothetical protein
MALSLGEWVAREQARRISQGLPARISDPVALGVLAGVLSTAQARCQTTSEPAQAPGGSQAA